jgi:hypothetical protein
VHNQAIVFDKLPTPCNFLFANPIKQEVSEVTESISNLDAARIEWKLRFLAQCQELQRMTK